jgi:hypothetical protein
MLLHGDKLISGSADTTIRRWSRGSFAYHLIKQALANCKNDPEQLQKIGAQLPMYKDQLSEKEYSTLEAALTKYATPADAECAICCGAYNPEKKIRMQLSCCKKQICKECAYHIFNMRSEYAVEFEGQQFRHAITKKCPYRNAPADQVQLLDQKK